MMDLFGRVATIATHKIFRLPVLVLMPHSSCNCRCVMCDIWKANHEKKEITTQALESHLDSFRKLGVKRIALSGGEALLHSNLWKFCDLLHSIGAKISLLSTGITLKHHAIDVVNHCDDVIVSLDGSHDTHSKIRNIPKAFEKLEEGVKALKAINPMFRVTGRTVIQKQNFKNFSEIIATARSLSLDQISFLGADVSSGAFNRADPWDKEKVFEVALSLEEVNEFEAILKKSFVDYKKEFADRFIAESPGKLLSICQHYRATAGHGSFPSKTCNAPWVSSVIESTGDVMPCFFHAPYGNIKTESFEKIINSDRAIAFRKKLNVASDPICQRCVCSLHLGIMQSV